MLVFDVISFHILCVVFPSCGVKFKHQRNQQVEVDETMGTYIVQIYSESSLTHPEEIDHLTNLAPGGQGMPRPLGQEGWGKPQFNSSVQLYFLSQKAIRISNSLLKDTARSNEMALNDQSTGNQRCFLRM